MREAVVFDSFPSRACSHSDSMSRIDSPRTNAPITIARSGSLRNTFVLHEKQLRDKRLGRLPDLRELELQLPPEPLHPARAKAAALLPRHRHAVGGWTVRRGRQLRSLREAR